MNLRDLINAIGRMKAETGSLVCLGCGYENSCGTHGCAILRKAQQNLQLLEDTVEKAKSEKMVNTRGDKVRSMSDREIALAMMEFFVDEHIKFCQNKPECVAAMDKGDCVPDDKCVECLVAWLQQPAEDGGAENA